MMAAVSAMACGGRGGVGVMGRVGVSVSVR